MKLRELFPDRALDVGIAEANMASVAGGMSAYGMIPFITTFTPFASRRICDQVAVSITYAEQNVKIVGTDPGIAAELNGGTHMSFEDVGIYRSMPGIVIFEPVDIHQLKQAMPQIVAHNGTVYIRMFRKETPEVFTDANYKFDLFKADKIRGGKDLSIFVSGLSAADCIEAADILSKDGIEVDLINIHTIKPIDVDAVVSSAKKTGAVLTVENHNVYGGLYSAVCEVLSKECPTKCDCIGIMDKFGQVGKLNQLKEAYGMTVNDIVSKAKALVSGKR
jgi:transketolase